MLKVLRRQGLIENYEQRPVGRMIRAGLRNEIKTAVGALRVAPKDKFLIFAQGRTGSTLLTSTLNRHSEVTCRDEILGLPRLFPKRFVENAARFSGATCFGFHVKVYQLSSWQRVNAPHQWLRRMQEGGWKIIYLWRENILRHVVSNAYAEAAGSYHQWNNARDARPDVISLPISRLHKWMEFRRHNLEVEREALSGLEFLELNYERHLQSSQTQSESFSLLQSYLGVNQENIQPLLRKSVDKPLSQIVSNYDEVAAALAGTAEERFLRE